MQPRFSVYFLDRDFTRLMSAIGSYVMPARKPTRTHAALYVHRINHL